MPPKRNNIIAEETEEDYEKNAALQSFIDLKETKDEEQSRPVAKNLLGYYGVCLVDSGNTLYSESNPHDTGNIAFYSGNSNIIESGLHFKQYVTEKSAMLLDLRPIDVNESLQLSSIFDSNCQTRCKLLEVLRVGMRGVIDGIYMRYKDEKTELASFIYFCKPWEDFMTDPDGVWDSEDNIPLVKVVEERPAKMQRKLSFTDILMAHYWTQEEEEETEDAEKAALVKRSNNQFEANNRMNVTDDLVIIHYKKERFTETPTGIIHQQIARQYWNFQRKTNLWYCF